MKLKSKDSKKIKVKDVTEMEFKYFKFNFSFVNRQYSIENLETEHKVEFLNRLHYWSSKPILQIGFDDKARGYELIDKSSFKKSVCVPERFYDAKYREHKSSDKFMVFRLYPNNNPLPIRIIGMFCSPVFYVLYFDRNHEFIKC